jgi:hypothetical protein
MNNMKREKGLQSLQKRKTNEESEQIDEISSDMAYRYLKGKRERDYDISPDGKSSKLKKPMTYAKMNKDAKSSIRALRTIEKAKKANEEVESIDEISKKTAFSAAATSQDPTEYDDKRVDKAEKIRDHIRRKWGKPALDHADAHGSATHWGREEPGKSVFTRGKPDKLAARAKTTYRMTNAGKANKQDLKARFRKEEKESRRGEARADIAAITQMNESYKTTFNAALTQYGIKSPSELDEEKRKEFFNFVDQNYKQGDN